jgi:zinc finger BED domain-containing protein 1 (E3 SUMO-protein ligase ZBED1)
LLLCFQAKHSELYKSIKSSQSAGQSGQPITAFCSKSPGNKSSLTSDDHYSNSHHRQKAISTALVDLISQSSLPLRLVETDGFKNFMSILDPRYNIPSRRTITRALNNSLQSMKDSIKGELDTLKDMNIADGNVHATTDLWSSRALEPIIVRLHYFNAKFQLQTRTVVYRHFGERHTAINIATAFEGILSEFGIECHQLGYVITGSAVALALLYEP